MQPQKKLKQPNKLTHESLEAVQKTKPISKVEKRKKKQIKKKHQPSAIRLEAINETFERIGEKAEDMIRAVNLGEEGTQKLQFFYNWKSKVKCRCERNIKYYCLKCMSKNEELPFPQVNLPINLTIVHHSSEKLNKSSILPFSFITKPEPAVHFFSSTTTDTSFLETEDPHTYVLYPHKSSSPLTLPICQNLKKLIILDCTWFQTDQILHSLPAATKFIRLQGYQSLYWRYNHHNERALSSAEAVMYFLREWAELQGQSNHPYDLCMFLYMLQLKIINEQYKHQQQEEK